MKRVAVIGALCLAACAPQGFPDTPLLQGVNSARDSEASKALVQRRLEERYRVGGPEAGLSEYLTSQGFKPRRTTASLAEGQPIYGEARLEEGWGICNKVVGVYWRADAAGTLTELFASYGDTGCF
jgi:hypothetical protein